MGTSGKTGPSRAWYILPSLTVLAAVLFAGFGLASFARFVGTDFHAYQKGSSISVTRDGVTVYAEDLMARAADLNCIATGTGGTVALRPVSGRTTMSNNDGTFTAIASTPPDMPAGQYVLSCVGELTGDDVPLYVGPRLDLAGVGRVVALGVVAPLFLGICSVVLFIIVAVLRYRAHRKAIATP